MKNLHKRILSVGVACSSLVGMAFVTLPKQPKGILTSLSLAEAKTELSFLESFTNNKGPEKETSDNASPKTTLKGRVQTTTNVAIALNLAVSEQNVQLTWITPQGHNSRKFIIQRSRDLEKFYDIAELKPTTEEAVHIFTDENPVGGFINHYRIIEFDANRNMHVYSPMAVQVSAINGEAFGVTLHTSEEGEMIRVKMDNVKESDVLLNTISGMGVPCDAVQKSKNEVILLPTYPLSPGEYIVKIRDVKDEKRFKVTFKRSEKMF
ncbi:MAG: hypothetical protein MUF58_07255 [Arcicella sp.]|jgi:hypothetical protein|nr:hypothetical protein [Arcicella sp.]